MEKEKKYLLSLDLSMSNSGVCIFDLDTETPVEIFSIPTDSKNEHGKRLKTISDRLYYVKNKYNLKVVVFEKGFSRFSASTQAIFKTVGVASCIFYDIPQIYLAPSTIKKIVSGNGRTDKKGIEEIVLKKYPNIELKDNDQSDAVSIGLAYFMGGKNNK